MYIDLLKTKYTNELIRRNRTIWNHWRNLKLQW